MENVIVDILKRLAKADAATKELIAQVEAQSLLLAALMLTVGKGSSSVMATNIEKAILSAASASDEILQSDVELLMAHFVRLITVSQFIEANGDEANSKEEATANDPAYAEVEATANNEATADDAAYAEVEATVNNEATADDASYADVEATVNNEATADDASYADVEATANNEVSGDDEVSANNEVTAPTNNKPTNIK